MNKNQIKVMVNGKQHDALDKIGQAFGSILSIHLPFYHFMSVEIIKHHLALTTEMIEEIQTKPLATITRMVRSIQNQIDNNNDKESLLSFITNIILAKDGFGLLPGFGMAAFEMSEGKSKIKGNLYIDPEKRSIY